MQLSVSGNVHRRAVPEKNRENKAPQEMASTQIMLMPDVHNLPDYYRIFLVEEQKLMRMKAEQKILKENMKLLVEHIKKELGQVDKKKMLFFVPHNQEEAFGVCAGLRLAKHSRMEQLSEKRLEEVTVNATAKIFEKYAPQDALGDLGRALAAEIHSSREIKVGYDIARVMPKGHYAENAKKRQKKE